MTAPAAEQTTTVGHGARAELIAHGLLFVTAILWGSSFVAVKLVVDDVPPMMLGMLRGAIAGVLLALFTRAQGLSLRVSRHDLGLLTLLGTLGIGYYYFGLNLGIQLTSASVAGLLGLPFPSMAALGAWLFLGEAIGRRRALGIAVALGAAAFLTVRTGTGDGSGSLLGNLLVLSTTLDWTAYTLVGRRYLHRWRGTLATTYIMLTGALVLVPAAGIEAVLVGPPRFTPLGVVMTLYLVLFCSVAAYLMWNRGLVVLGAARTAVYLYLQPVVAILIAMPVLGERISWDVALGGIVVLAGTVIAARR